MRPAPYPYPCPGLPPRAARIPEHAHPALQIASDVEEDARVHLARDDGNGELRRSDDELAPGADAALRIPPARSTRRRC